MHDSPKTQQEQSTQQQRAAVWGSTGGFTGGSRGSRCQGQAVAGITAWGWPRAAVWGGRSGLQPPQSCPCCCRLSTQRERGVSAPLAKTHRAPRTAAITRGGQPEPAPHEVQKRDWGRVTLQPPAPKPSPSGGHSTTTSAPGGLGEERDRGALGIAFSSAAFSNHPRAPPALRSLGTPTSGPPRSAARRHPALSTPSSAPSTRPRRSPPPAAAAARWGSELGAPRPRSPAAGAGGTEPRGGGWKRAHTTG